MEALLLSIDDNKISYLMMIIDNKILDFLSDESQCFLHMYYHIESSRRLFKKNAMPHSFFTHSSSFREVCYSVYMTGRMGWGVGGVESQQITTAL